MNERRKPTAQDILDFGRRMQKSGLNEKRQEQEVLRFAQQNMNASQKEKLQSILQDRQALQNLLQSEQARALMEKLNPKS